MSKTYQFLSMMLAPYSDLRFHHKPVSYDIPPEEYPFFPESATPRNVLLKGFAPNTPVGQIIESNLDDLEKLFLDFDKQYYEHSSAINIWDYPLVLKLKYKRNNDGQIHWDKPFMLYFIIPETAPLFNEVTLEYDDKSNKDLSSYTMYDVMEDGYGEFDIDLTEPNAITSYKDMIFEMLFFLKAYMEGKHRFHDHFSSFANLYGASPYPFSGYKAHLNLVVKNTLENIWCKNNDLDIGLLFEESKICCFGGYDHELNDKFIHLQLLINTKPETPSIIRLYEKDMLFKMVNTPDNKYWMYTVYFKQYYTSRYNDTFDFRPNKMKT